MQANARNDVYARDKTQTNSKKSVARRTPAFARDPEMLERLHLPCHAEVLPPRPPPRTTGTWSVLMSSEGLGRGSGRGI